MTSGRRFIQISPPGFIEHRHEIVAAHGSERVPIVSRAEPVPRGRIRLTQFLLFLVLAASGACWIPVLKLGSTVLELGNVADLVLIAFGALFILLRRLVNVPTVLNMIALLMLVLGVAFMVRDGAGIGAVIQATAALLAAYGIVNLEPLTARQVEMPVALALAAFIGLFAISSQDAGLDLADAILRYMTSLDRNRFIYELRGVWNAYATTSDFDYAGAVINTVSAAFSMFFLLSAALAVRGSRLMLLCAAISLGWVVVLFSSSAILICLLGGLVLVSRQIVFSSGGLRLSVLLLPAIIIVSLPLVGYVALFLESNIAADTASRGARLGTYAGAFELIDSSPLTGIGFVEVEGHVIHNLVLFGWTSAGIVAVLIVAAIYVCGTVVIVDGIAGAFRRSEFPAEFLIIGTLPILLLVRTLVGGAGGLPSGPTMTALAIALLVRRGLRRNETFASDRLRLRLPRGLT